MLHRRNNNRYVYAAPSGIHGQGLFARTDIAEGTDVVEYAGPRVRAEDGVRMAEEGNVYIFRANRRDYIDGSVAWNLARHANHSCDPNAKSVSVRGAIYLRALRDIKKGEEITYEYGYSFRDEPTPCRCKAALCSGFMIGLRAPDRS